MKLSKTLWILSLTVVFCLWGYAIHWLIHPAWLAQPRQDRLHQLLAPR